MHGADGHRRRLRSSKALVAFTQHATPVIASDLSHDVGTARDQGREPKVLPPLLAMLRRPWGGMRCSVWQTTRRRDVRYLLIAPGRPPWRVRLHLRVRGTGPHRAVPGAAAVAILLVQARTAGLVAAGCVALRPPRGRDRRDAAVRHRRVVGSRTGQASDVGQVVHRDPDVDELMAVFDDAARERPSGTLESAAWTRIHSAVWELLGDHDPALVNVRLIRETLTLQIHRVCTCATATAGAADEFDAAANLSAAGDVSTRYDHRSQRGRAGEAAVAPLPQTGRRSLAHTPEAP